MMTTKLHDSLFRGGRAVACLLAGAVASAALAQTQAPSAPPAPSAPQAAEAPDANPRQFLRIAEERNKWIALEIASRDYVRREGSGPGWGPRITLVGVAHIGDRAFYRDLQKLLNEYDVVLFESVKPPGTGGAGGETPQQRIDSTRNAVRFVGGVLEACRERTQGYPHDLEALVKFAQDKDARLAQWLQVALVDAWGRPLHYELTPATQDQPARIELASLGADGRLGGEGENADIELGESNPADPLPQLNDDNLQSQLADALGLEFQLEALDYSPANWRCSDMAMDEVSRRLAARGLDFDVLGGTLAGSSFPAKVVGILLRFIRFADSLVEGAIADTFKIMMIEMLSDESIIEGSMQQFGQGFGEVIINERNQVVIDDLKSLLEREPKVKSIAVLYGAGHMPDLAERLREQLAYEPAGERWLRAISVDIAKSAVSPAEVNRMRVMMRQMLRQQLGRTKR